MRSLVLTLHLLWPHAARQGNNERKDLGAGPAAETYEDNLWQITDQPDGTFVIENCELGSSSIVVAVVAVVVGWQGQSGHLVGVVRVVGCLHNEYTLTTPTHPRCFSFRPFAPPLVHHAR